MNIEYRYTGLSLFNGRWRLTGNTNLSRIEKVFMLQIAFKNQPDKNFPDMCIH